MVKNDKGEDEIVYMSDSEDETLGRKLARLKREAEEVRLQLQRLEQEKDSEGEFKDSVEQQQQQQQQEKQPEQEENIDCDGVEELSRVLDGLSVKAGLKGLGTTEEDFISNLDSNARHRQRRRQQTKDATSQRAAAQTPSSHDAPSALAAVAAFSDRLTALETALGVASTSAEGPRTTSILPILDSLSSQITTLFGALNPPTSNTTASAPHTTPLLDSVSSKLKTLTNESKTLEQSRKSALESLEKLHNTRMNQLVSANLHINTRPRRGLSNSSGPPGNTLGLSGYPPNVTSANNSTNNINNDPATGSANQQISDLHRPDDESLQITSRVFLEEQAAKVTALYQLLPSIQSLQPLLPVVLERLRALSVIHAGAAEAKNSLDKVERKQAEMQAEIKQWREAVEVVEKGMLELEESMKANAKVVGEMVGNLEGRIGSLSSRR